jgi:hypothetical protein
MADQLRRSRRQQELTGRATAWGNGSDPPSDTRNRDSRSASVGGEPVPHLLPGHPIAEGSAPESTGAAVRQPAGIDRRIRAQTNTSGGHLRLGPRAFRVPVEDLTVPWVPGCSSCGT